MSSEYVFVLLYLLQVLSVDSETNRSGQETRCTAKKVTVRDAYLALSPVSGSTDTMAILLDIPRGQWGNIQVDCRSSNDCRYRRMLEAWYNGHRSEPSWDELVFVLKQMGEYQLARGIQSKYLCFREEAKPVLNTIDIDISPQELFDSLEDEFIEMVVSTEEYFHTHHLDLHKLKSYLTNLPLKFKEPYKKLFEPDLIDKIKEADSVSKIFGYLSVHVWNFLESDVFQYIIYKFGSEELRSELQRYLSHVLEFRKTISLSQFLELWPNSDTPPSGYAMYAVKLQASPDKVTLEAVEQLRLKLARRYTLPAYAFRLAAVEEGCFLVRWFVRGVLVRNIVNVEAHTGSLLLTENHLMYLKAGDYVMFDVEHRKSIHYSPWTNKSLPKSQKSKQEQTNQVSILTILITLILYVISVAAGIKGHVTDESVKSSLSVLQLIVLGTLFTLLDIVCIFSISLVGLVMAILVEYSSRFKPFCCSLVTALYTLFLAGYGLYMVGLQATIGHLCGLMVLWQIKTYIDRGKSLAFGIAVLLVYCVGFSIGSSLTHFAYLPVEPTLIAASVSIFLKIYVDSVSMFSAVLFCVPVLIFVLNASRALKLFTLIYTLLQCFTREYGTLSFCGLGLPLKFLLSVVILIAYVLFVKFRRVFFLTLPIVTIVCVIILICIHNKRPRQSVPESQQLELSTSIEDKLLKAHVQDNVNKDTLNSSKSEV